MKYVQFSNMPMKARIKWVQDKLITLGYLDEYESVPFKRDKKFVRALKKFQESYGMVQNADFTEELFEKLNYN